ncbi:MAG: hypothetical protein C4344_03240 [Acidimicrobiia bacterium]
MGLLDRLQAARAAGAPTGEGSGGTHAAPGGPRQEWGRPGNCPACGGRGYLDHIDLIDRVMYQHCTSCGHEWEVHEAETVPPKSG